ncbi:hypothetical protein H8356DRAFT_1434301 [Neocallimastix lanati (nom. inval.)]|nr:hypothetical protein H8356DRAFT_1434301 [Neocallimastix sp. JGI-2020a]
MQNINNIYTIPGECPGNNDIKLCLPNTTLSTKPDSEAPLEGEALTPKIYHYKVDTRTMGIIKDKYKDSLSWCQFPIYWEGKLLRILWGKTIQEVDKCIDNYKSRRMIMIFSTISPSDRDIKNKRNDGIHLIYNITTECQNVRFTSEESLYQVVILVGTSIENNYDSYYEEDNNFTTTTKKTITTTEYIYEIDTDDLTDTMIYDDQYYDNEED